MKKKQLIGIMFLMVCLLVAVSSVYSYIKPPCYDCGTAANCQNGNGLEGSGYDSCEIVLGYGTTTPVGCVLGNWGC